MMTMAKISLLAPVHWMASIQLSAITGKIWPVPSQGGIRPWIRIFPVMTRRERSGTSNAARRIARFFYENADGMADDANIVGIHRNRSVQDPAGMMAAS